LGEETSMEAKLDPNTGVTLNVPTDTATLTLRRVVHASVLLDFGGPTVLTDPWFSEKDGFPAYYWGEPLGVALGDLPELSGVVSSHGHYDHYDVEAFSAYPDKAVPFAVKRGTGAKARVVGFTHVTELDPWETTQLGPVKVTAAPAKHGMPENTYVLEASGFTVFFGGDTLLIPELGEVAERFPKIDLALLAINGLKLRPMLNRQVVMNAGEAAELVAMLSPRFAVPIHYSFTGGPLGDRVLVKHDGKPEEFEREARRLAPRTEIRVLAPGEPFRISQKEER
jgi:L-ascorbate metabolism protein UlaG (beta-lactamase superfamily)